MPLADLLRPEQRQWLRRLRRRIANREVMRRQRAATRDKRLCAGVDLPLDAGTCGRLVWPAHERCYGLPRAAPVASQPRAQPRRDRRGRAARARRGRRRNARRRPVRGHRPSRPPARRSVHARRSLPALVAPNTRPALPQSTQRFARIPVEIELRDPPTPPDLHGAPEATRIPRAQSPVPDPYRTPDLNAVSSRRQRTAFRQQLYDGDVVRIEPGRDTSWR